VRLRVLKACRIRDGRVLVLVADADRGVPAAITTFPVSRMRGLENIRVGRPLMGRTG